MMDEKLEGLTITVAQSTVGLNLAYPDGSLIQLTMPKPAGIGGLTSEQAASLVRRMGSRLLGVALEDLSKPA